MNPNNPANTPCTNEERSPDRTHKWVGRADGTAWCIYCALELMPHDAKEVVPGLRPELPPEPDKKPARRVPDETKA